MRHYEIVFFRRYKTTGQYLIDWSCSYKTFNSKKNAIRYAEQVKDNRQFRVYKVETDINGNPTKGYTGFELVNKLYKEFR